MRSFAGIQAGQAFGFQGMDRTMTASILVLPFWFIALAAALLPFVRTIAFVRRRRWRPGLCRQCFYDLRAHKPGDKCPECGMIVENSPEPGKSISKKSNRV